LIADSRAVDEIQPQERTLAQPRPLCALERFVLQILKMYIQELADHFPGHACMLQYAMLHLYGYAISMDDIKSFRVSLCRFSR